MSTALPNDSAETLVLGLSNESTLTLVAPQPSLHTLLVLSADSIRNTTFSALGVPVFKLRTEGTSTRTDLLRCGAEPEVVASVDRRLLGDVILWPDGSKVKVRKWARFVKLKDDTCVFSQCL
jgi:hypothetical protein